MANELTARIALDPFGRSLFLSEQGDLVFERNDDGLLDLRTSGGVANLAQGLRITLATPLGTDIFNQLFGFDLLSILRAGYTLSITKQLIRLHTVRAVTSDDRVLRIEELVVDDEPRAAELHPDADPDARRRQRKVTRHWQLEVLIQPIAGRPVTVPVQVSGV
jgi:phage baseplate assembly protein W